MTRSRFGGPRAGRLGLVAAGGTAVLLSSIAGAVTPAAHAEVVSLPGPGLRPVTRTYEAAMTVAGIDRAVAARAGNTVRTEGGATVLYDGRSGEVLARVAGPGAVGHRMAPLNTVRGNCGASYITITWLGGSRYNVVTGFKLNRRAIGWSWGYSVRADDNRGVYDFEWDDSGVVEFKRSWSFTRTDTTDHRGDTHVARVTKGLAFVPNGIVCFSGYPTDAIYIPR